MSIEQLTQEALALPNDLRLQLVNTLLTSLEPEMESSVQRLWMAEAQRRREEILSGEVQPIEGDIALAQVRAILD
ncbi:MAG: addiction module protein [Spirulina sp. SIO3F2]|nr:addiction module protein [Spirulina sp. SIO3F2]